MELSTGVKQLLCPGRTAVLHCPSSHSAVIPTSVPGFLSLANPPYPVWSFSSSSLALFPPRTPGFCSALLFEGINLSSWWDFPV